MSALRALLLVSLALSIASCDRGDRAAHTVDYYRAHKQERRDKARECIRNPGELGKTPDCVNALQADSVESIGSFRNLPPMDIPPAPPKPKP